MNVTVVVPSNREGHLRRFLHEWRGDLAGARVIVVEDRPATVFGTVSWADIDSDLGAKGWVIPRYSSAVRSYGTLLAWREGADVIWHLDDDCWPEPGNRGGYLTSLQGILGGTAEQGSWWNTIPSSGLYPRGFPYGIREQRRPVMVHHGLWSNVPDLDGVTQKANPDFRLPSAEGISLVPVGQFFPMCGMNLAFRAEMAPAMYMLLMGHDRDGDRLPFDRFDDMWAGLFAKRICDHLGYAITSGAPSVHHSRASDPDRNAVTEAPGIAAHEELWPFVAEVRLTGKTVAECYGELGNAVAGFAGGGYWRRLGEAMMVWAGLFGG